MNAEGRKEIFLSCFKCGRIVKSSDSECPRCGLQFGPGTLFECPFCCGLVWRNATTCSTCGTDLTAFSDGVEKSSSGFDMDEFVDNIINTELEEIKCAPKRVACPGCGLMIRGDEDKCPRCDLPLEEAQVDCPVCGEKISVSANACPNCQAVFAEVRVEAREPKEAEVAGAAAVGSEARSEAQAKGKREGARKLGPPKKKGRRKARAKKEKRK
ncbi:MAG: double zinc ribbon domain-containing protein [Thermoplasmata archaeon]